MNTILNTTINSEQVSPERIPPTLEDRNHNAYSVSSWHGHKQSGKLESNSVTLIEDRNDLG